MKKSPPTSRAGTDTPLHLGQTELERRLRQHVVLNLPAELELAADALLLDERPLVQLDVGGHLIEGAGQPPDLVVRLAPHARAVVALRDAVHAFAQALEIAREPRGQRHDADQRQHDEPEAEAGVERRRAAQVAHRVAHRPRDAELQPRAGGIGRGHDDPVADDAWCPAGVPASSAGDSMRLDRVAVGLGRRVRAAVLRDGERHLAAVALASS